MWTGDAFQMHRKPKNNDISQEIAFQFLSLPQLETLDV